MKVREGFVSNSSSSSYIIKLNKVEVCPHCGRGDSPDILEFFRNHRDTYGDSSLDYGSKEQLLSDISSEIKHLEQQIQKYSAMDPGFVPNRRFNNKITAKEYLEWTREDLRHAQNRLAEISGIDGDIIGISVGYHDDGAQTMFDMAVKSGAVEIIEGP